MNASTFIFPRIHLSELLKSLTASGADTAPTCSRLVSKAVRPITTAVRPGPRASLLHVVPRFALSARASAVLVVLTSTQRESEGAVLSPRSEYIVSMWSRGLRGDPLIRVVENWDQVRIASILPFVCVAAG